MWPPPSPLTEDFWLAFVAAGCYCGTVLILSRCYSERLVGKRMTSLSHADQTLWHSYIYCVLPGAICWLLICPDLARMWNEGLWDSHHLTSMTPSRGSLRAVGWELGFLAFDLGTMLLWRAQILEATEPSMYVQMLVHHILSLVIWPQALQRHSCVGIVLYLASTEVTSLFINLRWLLVKAKLSKHPVYYINGGILVVSFVLVRIIPIPWLLRTLYTGTSDLTALEFGTAWLTVPIPVVLNLYWFSIIVGGIRDSLCPRRERQQAQEQQEQQQEQQQQQERQQPLQPPAAPRPLVS